jgi:uncharacterized protein (TIGR00730 family)
LTLGVFFKVISKGDYPQMTQMDADEDQEYRRNFLMNAGSTVKRVCVYCASSRQVDPCYLEQARQLGRLFAQNGVTMVYGGGGVGLMGAAADGALEEGGAVIGVIPRFMIDLEWGRQGLTELHVVQTMHERKQQMLEHTAAAVALPGGSGTLEELVETITLKRLGLYINPIIIVNIAGFFDPLLAMFQRAVDQRFMDSRHLDMWTVVERAAEVLPAIERAPRWTTAVAQSFAAL